MSTNHYFIALAAIVPTVTTATETTAALLVAAGVAGDGPGPQAKAVVAGWRGLRTSHDGRGSVLSPHKEADLGALATVQRRLQSNPCPTSCPPNQVGYCIGSPISTINGGLLCDNLCCVGYACFGFTGCVSRDGSCGADDSCLDAFAPSGIENSCKAYASCEKLGFYGVVGALKDSCNEAGACKSLARDGGEVGALTQSCNGYYSCHGLGRDSGKVGMLHKSCNDEYSCDGLGTNGGFVGSITKSCIRDYSCKGLATNTGSIASITKTCNNAPNTPCQFIDKEGAVGHLTKFTHAQILAGKKYRREVIGTIEDCNVQCVDDSECMGIKWKDHTGMPCRFYGGEVSANLCGGRNVCITV